MDVDEILFHIWIEVINMNKFHHYTKTLYLLVSPIKNEFNLISIEMLIKLYYFFQPN